jgi:hypothetical protein
LWNVQNDWISFGFQIGHGFEGKGKPLSQLVEYIGGQMLIAGPLVFAGAVAVLWRGLRGTKGEKFLAWMSLPVIVFFALTSLRRSAGPNWPSFAYLAVALAVGRAWVEARGRWRGFWDGAVIFSAVMALVLTAHARFGVLPLGRFSEKAARTDQTKWFYGWRELAEAVRAAAPEAEFVIVPTRQLAAEFMYYGRERWHVYVDELYDRIPMTEYFLWGFDARYRDRRGAYVCRHPYEPRPYLAFFEFKGVADPEAGAVVITHEVPGHAEWTREYKVVPMDGYLPRDPPRRARDSRGFAD